jgi:hypothetical protein
MIQKIWIDSGGVIFISRGFNMLTVGVLKEQLHYDTSTGVFTRLICNSSSSLVGDIVGSTTSQGYLVGRVKGTSYKMHRLAWLYVYGVLPNMSIDHINGVKSDNSILNLRLATHSQNNRNVKRRRDNKSGIKGVCFIESKGSWRARVTLHGASYDTYHTTVESAELAVIKLRTSIHGAFANSGVL